MSTKCWAASQPAQDVVELHRLQPFRRLAQAEQLPATSTYPALHTHCPLAMPKLLAAAHCVQVLLPVHWEQPTM